MNLLSAIGAGLRAFRNHFESASDNPQRSSTVYFPLDSKREIAPYQRRELVKKHRYLRNNLGFVKGIIDTTVRLSIGWGLQPVPRSPDSDFNKRAKAYWLRNTRRQSFDVAWQDTEPSMQRLVLREVITDGEMFAIKVVDEMGMPQRQLLKTEVIGDPPNKSESANWCDGVLCNSLGRPLEYAVLQTPNPLQPRTPRAELVEARDMIHVYNRERSTQHRGLPWGYTGLNHGIDALDIGSFEKITHKLNTAVIGSLTTPTGQAPQSMRGLLDAAQEASAAGATNRNTRESVQYLDLHGSKIPIFKSTESMNLYLQGRNSINAVEFIGWLCAQYAHGFGLPVEVIVGMIQGSAATRGNLEFAGRFFEENQMLMIDDWCQPNWENIIGLGILASQYPRDFPLIEPLSPPQGWLGWDICEWRGPRNVTIDRGRDGKLYLEQLRAGIMTREEYWMELGEDPDVMDEKSDLEVKKRRDRWVNELLLPEDMFWKRELGQVAGSTPAPTAEPSEEGSAGTPARPSPSE